MLTKGDDYPLHQRPEPVALAGGERNFYDRYFFNGYARQGQVFFALALGVYPHRQIMDASFCMIADGIQHNLRASRHLGLERLDTQVGPIQVQVVEPLRTLRILVHENDSGLLADLTFHRRAPAVEEPRFQHMLSPTVSFDYTRLTQNGTYEGFLSLSGRRIEVTRQEWVGTRDRSWGIRPLGSAAEHPPQPGTLPQFYWLWAPINFDDCVTLYEINTDANGTPWHTYGTIVRLPDGPAESLKSTTSRVEYRSGTRHARSAEILFVRPDNSELRLHLEPRYSFFMSGLGYLHPEWGHGMDKGKLAIAYDTIDTASVDPANPLYLHIQAICDAKMDGRSGIGVLEQLVIGPHAPSGFTSLLDMAP